MKCRIFLIGLDLVVAEDQSIDRFGIKNRLIEGFKVVVLDDDVAMEVFLLIF